MIRTIYLHGALGKRFGREILLAVESPAEAMRALCTMLKGFEAHVTERYYQVFRGRKSKGLDLNPQELHVRFSDVEAELHIVPRAAGAKRQGLGKVILGGLLIAASFVVPGAWAIGAGANAVAVSGVVAQAGVAMVLGGVSQMLAPQRASDYENRDQPQSALFSSAINVTTPGVPVPVVVGECEVGSVVVSAAIHVEDRASDA
ncbi:tail assembly protein [Rhodobacteraceae bacterium G21628-S1]|nr:tail assembly protein [Rhodobacteraceae bacterium G21628-S1]